MGSLWRARFPRNQARDISAMRVLAFARVSRNSPDRGSPGELLEHRSAAIDGSNASVTLRAQYELLYTKNNSKRRLQRELLQSS